MVTLKEINHLIRTNHTWTAVAFAAYPKEFLSVKDVAKVLLTTPGAI
jgi:hypothetical protein